MFLFSIKNMKGQAIDGSDSIKCWFFTFSRVMPHISSHSSSSDVYLSLFVSKHRVIHNCCRLQEALWVLEHFQLCSHFSQIAALRKIILHSKVHQNVSMGCSCKRKLKGVLEWRTCYCCCNQLRMR